MGLCGAPSSVKVISNFRNLMQTMDKYINPMQVNELTINGEKFKGKVSTDFDYTESSIVYKLPAYIKTQITEDGTLIFTHISARQRALRREQERNFGRSVSPAQSTTSSISVISGPDTSPRSARSAGLRNTNALERQVYTASNNGKFHVTVISRRRSSCSTPLHDGEAGSSQSRDTSPPPTPLTDPNSVHIPMIGRVHIHGFDYEVSQPVNLTYAKNTPSYVEMFDGLGYCEYTHHNGSEKTTAIAEYNSDGKFIRKIRWLGRFNDAAQPSFDHGSFFFRGIKGHKWGFVDGDSPIGDGSYFCVSFTFYRRLGDNVDPSIRCELKQPVWIVTSPQETEEDWVKDLTLEDIESNPGPEFTFERYINLVRKRTYSERQLSWAKSIGFEVKARVEAIWEAVGMTEVSYDWERYQKSDRLTLHEKEKYAAWRGLKLKSAETGEAYHPQGRQVQPGTTARGGKQTGKQEGKTQENKQDGEKHDVSAVVTRVCERLQEGGLVTQTKWALLTKARKWTTLVATKLWGEGWEKVGTLNYPQWVVFCDVNCVANAERVSVLLDADPKFRDVSDKEAVASVVSGSTYLEACARMHNKLVHSLNGNIFIRDMAQVDATQTAMKFLEAQHTGNTFNPITWETNITCTGADRWARGNNSILQFGPVRARKIDRANMIVEGREVPYPLTPFSPLQMIRKVETPLKEVTLDYIADTFAHISAMNVEYTYNPLVPCDKYTKLVADITNSVSFKIRQNDATVSGFSTDDVVSLLGTLNRLGLSMECPLMKLLLMVRALSYVDIAGSTPNCLFQTYFPTAREGLAVNPDFERSEPLELSLNDVSAYKKETDDGKQDPDAPKNNDEKKTAQFEFPFGGGRGHLRFHVNLATVPASRRAYAVFLPAVLLGTNNTKTQHRLALFVMSLAPWPFGMYSVVKRVNAEANAEMHFLCNECMVDIPGQTEIDIILPRTVATNNPVTLADAHRYVTVIPRVGPISVDDLVANTNINVCYDGNTTTVPLVTYMLTYGAAISSQTALEFIEDMASTVGMLYTLPPLDELVTYLTYRSCPLVPVGDAQKTANAIGNYEHRMVENISDRGDGSRDTIGLKQQTLWGADLDLITGDGERGKKDFDEERIMAFNVPTRKPRKARFVLAEFSSDAWNKIALGLATASNVIYEDRRVFYGRLSNKKHVVWNMMTAMFHGLVWQVYYHSVGLSVACWNSPLVEPNPNVTFARMLDNTFVSPVTDYDRRRPPFSDMLRSIGSSCFGTLPHVLTIVRQSGEPLPMDVYDRLLRPLSFAGTIYATDDDAETLNVNTSMCPTIMLDFWVHYFSQDCPKFMSAFPPPEGRNGTQGYDSRTSQGPMSSLLGQGNRIGPYVSDTVKRGNFPNSVFPTLDDQTRWNMQIIMTDPRGYVILDYAANALVGIEYRGLLTTVPIHDPHNVNNRPATDWDTSALCATCLPIVTHDNWIPVSWTKPGPRPPYDILRTMTRQSSTNREAWLLDDVNAQTPYYDEVTDSSLFSRILNSTKSTFLDSGVNSVVVPTPASTSAKPQIAAPTLAASSGTPGGGGGPGPSASEVAAIIPLAVESTKILESANGAN